MWEHFFNLLFAEISSFAAVPGSIHYQKDSNTLSVCCKVKHICTLKCLDHLEIWQLYCLFIYTDVLYIWILYKLKQISYVHLSGWLGWIQNSNVKEKIISSRFLQWVSSPECPEKITVPEQLPVSELQRENGTES